MLVALGPSVANDSVPFHDMHGHFLFLTPNPTLLRPMSGSVSFVKKPEVNFAMWPLNKVKIERISYDPFSVQLNTQLMPINPEYIKTTIDRYIGSIDLDSNGKIKSRHCEHPENSRIIDALLNDKFNGIYSFYTFFYI